MIVENVVAFEIAAAVVEKYVGTSLERSAAMEAIHALPRASGPLGRPDAKIQRSSTSTRRPPRQHSSPASVMVCRLIPPPKSN